MSSRTFKRESSWRMGVQDSNAVSLIIEPDSVDLGELTVRRALPDRRRRRVGPFVFWDYMGPAEFPPGAGVAVRPHPHIGLATITYLFEGTIFHRDSLGYAQPITPGAVNWMTAGRGIVHSERTPPELVESGSALHGIQAWVALPGELEECEPRFEHYPADRMPTMNKAGVRLTAIAGQAYGISSPVETASETILIEADLDADATLETPRDVDELAVFSVSGAVTVDGVKLGSGHMAVLADRAVAKVRATTRSKILLLGGATIAGRRIVWWNFVSSSRERIEQAKADWQAKRFGDVPGDPEFIPLPED